MINISRPRNNLHLILLVLFVIFIIPAIGCSSRVNSNPRVYSVQKVIDGDTIKLTNGSKVRYIGIDTPETMIKIAGKWIFSPEPFSVEAKNFNIKLIDKENIILEFDKDKTDKYGRMLAYVFLEDGRMVNAELIKNGLATIYTFYPNVKYLDQYLELQKEACLKQRGLWQGVKTISFDEAYSALGKIRRVVGKVSKIYTLRNYLILDLISDSKTIFTVEISLRNIPLFKEKGIDPFLDYTDKNIIITGKIKDGPLMYVDNPSQIQLYNQ